MATDTPNPAPAGGRKPSNRVWNNAKAPQPSPQAPTASVRPGINIGGAPVQQAQTAPAAPQATAAATVHNPPPNPQKTGMGQIKAILVQHKHLIQFPPEVGITAEQAITTVLVYISGEQRHLQIGKEPTLMFCTPRSILESVVAAARLGLVFAGGEAYLRPNSRKDSRGDHAYWYASLMVGYPGFVNVAARNGFFLTCQPVFAGEEPTIDPGALTIHHPMVFGKGPRGPLVGAYAVARRMSDMAIVHLELMSREQIEEVKGDTWVWNDHYDEMARTRPIRRAFKYLPKLTSEMRLANTIVQTTENGESVAELLDIEEQPGPAAED